MEVRQTRLLMGVNYHSDLEAGFALGQAVAQQALARATTDGTAWGRTGGLRSWSGDEESRRAVRDGCKRCKA